jgi:endonuclease/exonuclease/phosphatase family metal-dependent hydrolase
LKRAATLGALLAIAVGCGAEISSGGDWQPWDTIDGPLRPELDADSYAGPADVGALRIATFNVELGRDTAAIARALADDDALARTDILLVQEIESHPGEGESRAAALARELSMNYTYAPSRELEGGGTHGLAVMSHFGLERVEVMQLPVVDIEVRPRQRIALGVDIRVGDGVLRVVDVHLDTRINITRRILQLHPVIFDAEPRIVIGGDFNTNPYLWAGSVIPVLPAQTVSDFDQADALDDYMRAYDFDTPTADSGPTQDAGIARFRLDALYTRDVVPLATGVGANVGISDHVPLWVDVDLLQ